METYIFRVRWDNSFPSIYTIEASSRNNAYAALVDQLQVEDDQIDSIFFRGIQEPKNPQ